MTRNRYKKLEATKEEITKLFKALGDKDFKVNHLYITRRTSIFGTQWRYTIWGGKPSQRLSKKEITALKNKMLEMAKSFFPNETNMDMFRVDISQSKQYVGTISFTYIFREDITL